MTEQNTHIQDQELSMDELETINGGLWKIPTSTTKAVVNSELILRYGGIYLAAHNIARNMKNAAENVVKELNDDDE